VQLKKALFGVRPTTWNRPRRASCWCRCCKAASAARPFCRRRWAV